MRLNGRSLSLVTPAGLLCSSACHGEPGGSNIVRPSYGQMFLDPYKL